MRPHRVIQLSLATLLSAAVPASAQVRVSMRDGQVAIVAKDATVAEILAEWSRLGDVKVVNADRLPSTRMTIELRDVTEQDALDVLLRGMGGYIARRRAVPEANASVIDCIVLMAQSAPVPVVAGTPPGRAPAADARPAAPLLPPAVAQTEEPVSSEPVQQAAVVPEAAPENEAIENDAPASAGGIDPGTATAMERAQPTLRARRALETADPRDFHLPGSTTGTRPGPAVRSVPGVTSPAKR
jgi:hypothetical protein